MAKAKSAAAVEGPLQSSDPSISRPRLHKLRIKNFCAIGPVAVEIELDDIVVLVGPNNSGKSSILRAYQVVMNHGSKDGTLGLADFPNGKLNADALPEIQLDTIVFDNTPGTRWIETTPNGEMLVRERWQWDAPGAPKRQGFDVDLKEWSDQVPWGAPNVAKSRRPRPHRIDAFASPDEQAEEIIAVLTSILTDRLKELKGESGGAEGGELSKYAQLLEGVAALQKEVVKTAQTEIQDIQARLTGAMDDVFPGYRVEFDARPEDELERCLSFFKGDPQLLLGPANGYLGPVDRQGSGARRTLLWTALRVVKEREAEKAAKVTTEVRPHVLLLDEPEICLHPNAIREARRVLYALPAGGNWQVMVTTHSPVFIDLSRDNTTIVRVERDPKGGVLATTLFRPKRAQLDDGDRERLKLLNLCDPHVNEFFFGGRTIVVEGDTEYTALRHVAESDAAFRDIHIVRARGKATIVSLVKVLNHFGSRFAVLHDSDTPTVVTKGGKTMANPAWTVNTSILAAVNAAPDPKQINLMASIPGFEGAYLGSEASKDKPFYALSRLLDDPAAKAAVVQLLRSLVDPGEQPPEWAIRWTKIEDLGAALKQWEEHPQTWTSSIDWHAVESRSEKF